MRPDSTDREIQEKVDMALSAFKGGNIPKAESLCAGILEKAPNNLEALQMLGLIYANQNKFSQAAELFGRAAMLKPDSAKIYNNLGVAEMRQGNLEHARAAFAKAVSLQKDFKQAHNNLGLVLKKQGKFAESAAALKKAISIDPGYVEAFGNLGMTFLAQGKFAQAAENLQKAIELKPDVAEFHNNLGNAMMELGRFDEAIAAFEKAIEIEPQSAQPHHNLSLVLILTGQFKKGWDEFEWRWKNTGFSTPQRPFRQSLWDGSAINGKLLVWGEQGIGDEVQFSGLIPHITAKGVKVAIECDNRLVGLLQRSFPHIPVAGRTEPPAELLMCDSITHQIPLCSIPNALGWPLEVKPHLVPDENLRQNLRGKYKDGKDVLLAGISWKSGNVQEGGKRSIDLPYWEPILKIPGVKFVSLQYGQCQKQLQEVHQQLGIEIIKDETINPFTDLEGFAAQTAAMDLIISIDNSTVHFAGTLGINVWTLLPKVPDWRWGLEGETTCWYPTMRLFRQQETGNWQPVISKVVQELGRLV